MNTSSSIERIPPDFIEPATIRDMNEEQQTELLQGIRSRRLIAVVQHQQIMEEKKRVKEEAYQLKYDRLATKLAKSVEKIDLEIEKINDNFAKLRVLRFEALDE